jgi:SpoVK/Ycf46/Vps4 family AAA+-type ATPase
MTDPNTDLKNSGFTSDLVFALRSLSRLTYVVTEEEDVFLKKLRNLVKRFGAKIQVYSQSFGLVPIDQLVKDWKQRTHAVDTQTLAFHDVLDKIYTSDPTDAQNFYVITDPEILLPDPMVQRRLLDIVHQLHNDEHNVKLLLFLSNRKYIPPKLSRYIQVVEDKGLSPEDILATLERPCKALKIPVPPNYAELFRGMTSYEIEAAVSQSIVLSMENPKMPQDEIVPENIHAFRRTMLKKTGLLEYIDTSKFTQSDIGGVERFKSWAQEMKAVFTEEGRSYGLKIPKGILLVGVWGTGKSLSAKTLGAEWGLPVVLLEMGKLRSSGVGDTEANIYSVLKMVESVAPCVTGETEVTLADGTSRTIESLWQGYVSGSDRTFRVQCEISQG